MLTDIGVAVSGEWEAEGRKAGEGRKAVNEPGFWIISINCRPLETIIWGWEQEEQPREEKKRFTIWGALGPPKRCRICSFMQSFIILLSVCPFIYPFTYLFIHSSFIYLFLCM